MAHVKPEGESEPSWKGQGGQETFFQYHKAHEDHRSSTMKAPLPWWLLNEIDWGHF